MKKGFTLLELVIVTAVIMVLLSSAVFLYKTIDYDTKKQVAQKTTDLIVQQLYRYADMNKGIFPDDINTFLENKNYFDKIPIDPFTGLSLISPSTLTYDPSFVKIKDLEGSFAGSTEYFSQDDNSSVFNRPSPYGGDP